MHIHYFQHVHFEGPGHIERWANEHGHQVTSTRFFEAGHTLPDLAAIDVLIVLGGPMSIYDERDYEWLVDEKRFIGEAIEAGKKILGICLGAQLLANVLGAAVKPAPNKEIGWFSISRTDESKQLPLFHELFKDQTTVLHWHADKFELPYGALDLAYSAANKNQAFAVGQQLLGLQFHIETMPDNVQALVEHAYADSIPGNFVQDEAVLLAGIQYAEEASICNRLLTHFLI